MPNTGDKFRFQDRGDRNRRLQDDVPLVAGVDYDDGKTPRFLPISQDGVVVDMLGGGLALPRFDYFAVTRYGATNNIHTIVFKLGGSGGATVATLELTYFGGGAADDDQLQSLRLI